MKIKKIHNRIIQEYFQYKNDFSDMNKHNLIYINLDFYQQETPTLSA